MILALLLLAACLAANVLLGPLGTGTIVWRVSANGLNQTYGADAAILVLVVPAALAAAWFRGRGRRVAAPLALGVGLAALYGVAETLGGDYLRYDGNNERFFLLFLAVIILGWTIAARAWAALEPAPVPPPIGLARGFAATLALGGLLIGAAWLAQLLAIARTGLVGPEYTDSPSAFWTIRIVDLGFIVPICLATGIGLWRKHPVAIKAAYGVAAFMTLQAAAVLAMGAVMLWHNDPTASVTLVAALAPITLALIACTVALLRSYAGGATAGSAPTAPISVPT